MTPVSAPPGPRRLRDDGSIVVGWLLKLTLVLCGIGVVAYDAIGVAGAHVRVTDDAQSVAMTVGDALWERHATPAQARRDGIKAAVERGDTAGPAEITILPGKVIVKLRTQATTVVLDMLPFTRKYTTADSTATLVLTPTGYVVQK